MYGRVWMCTLGFIVYTVESLILAIDPQWSKTAW